MNDQVQVVAGSIDDDSCANTLASQAVTWQELANREAGVVLHDGTGDEDIVYVSEDALMAAGHVVNEMLEGILRNSNRPATRVYEGPLFTMWCRTSCQGWVAWLVDWVIAGNSHRISLKVQVLGRTV